MTTTVRYLETAVLIMMKCAQVVSQEAVLMQVTHLVVRQESVSEHHQTANVMMHVGSEETAAQTFETPAVSRWL